MTSSRPNINYYIEETDEYGEEIEDIYVPTTPKTAPAPVAKQSKKMELLDKIQNNLHGNGRPTSSTINYPEIPTPNLPSQLPPQQAKSKVKTLDDLLKKMRVQYIDENHLQYQPHSIAIGPPRIYEESYPAEIQQPFTDQQIKQHILNEKIKRRIAELKSSQIKSRKLILPNQNIQVARGSDDLNKLFGFVGR